MSHKNLHMNVYCGFIKNSQKLEAIKMLFNGGMFKQTMIHPHDENKWVIKPWKFLDETVKSSVVSREPG